MKIKKGKLNGYYVTMRPMWEYAAKLNPNLYGDYKDFLAEPATSRAVDMILQLVWQDVHNAIMKGARGTEKFQGLPTEVLFSMTCIEQLLKRPELIDAVRDGVITPFMLRRMAKLEVIYK